MLQIATGKLFTLEAEHENFLRGIIYTNAQVGREAVIETAAGRLLPSSSYSIQPTHLIFEFVERIEAQANGPGVLISSGVEPYLQDFSIVASFALNCVCTHDVDLARRLTSGQRGLATRSSPPSLVTRFFDKEVFCTPDELQFLIDFIKKLIELPRQTFLGVMRSLRNYVNGMHRIVDDTDLAYTLLVTSVESLAQDFDGHNSDWESVDERKRTAIDKALIGADDDLAERVRNALLKVEHVALARRFREFTIAHTEAAYFREKLDKSIHRLGREDIREALSLAYESRSKYVHQLKRLPDTLTMGHGYGEIAQVDRSSHLTFQGLSRLMRNAIITFVMRQPSILQEEYNYQLERAGVTQMRLAPQYWVGRVAGDITIAGRDKLQGFLSQLASCYLKEPNAVITDLGDVLRASSSFVANLEKKLRLPYLTLHCLFNQCVKPESRVEINPKLNTLIERELSEPSAESLISFTLSYQQVDWALDVHQKEIRNYFRRRSAKNGIRFPRLFESAIVLDLAERYRLSADLTQVKNVIAMAVENNPGNTELLEFEATYQIDQPIKWYEILLPSVSEPMEKEGQQ